LFVFVKGPLPVALWGAERAHFLPKTPPPPFHFLPTGLDMERQASDSRHRVPYIPDTCLVGVTTALQYSIIDTWTLLSGIS